MRGSHGELCKSIVKEVLVNLTVKDRIVTDDLVGMQERVEGVLECLDIRAPGVRYLGIHGIGGSGKTTLTKTVFNRISASFEACSFLADVRESSRPDLQYLQKKLICCLLENYSRDISDTDDGVKVLSDICRSKKILIVLDDVDRSEQVESLVGSSSWFGSGSRIIITTRDVRVLPKQDKFEQGRGENKPKELWTLEMKEMDSEYALQLFSRHAFKSDHPPTDYIDVLREVVSAIGHLPLALEIIGSHLCGKPKEALEDKRSSLVRIPHNNIRKMLMLSYEALDFWTKQIFLDIACFPVNLEKVNAMSMWRSCGFLPEIGIEELVSLSMVKIVDKDVSWMHDHLRDLGREIVRMENYMDFGECSRVCDPEEALGLLKRKEGTGKIEVLQLPTDCSMQDCFLTPEHFRNLRNLRFLQCSGLNLVGDFEHQLSKLRWLSWHHCPRDFMATNLNLEKLAVLELRFGKITEKWDGWSQIKVGDSLEILDLSSSNIRRTPDLSQFRNLTRLILEDCVSLREIDSSIGKLKRLKHLNLKGCRSLRGLPVEIGSLEALEEIFLESYADSTQLAESIGNLKSLVILEAFVYNLKSLPHTIGGLGKLKRLKLAWCCGIESLPETLGGFHSLIELDMSRTPITELPDSLGCLEKLERLHLSLCEEIKNLPDSLGDLKSLCELDISYSGLVELPDSIGDLEELKVINMEACHVHELPRSVGKMKKLEKLVARRSPLKGGIPNEIGRLSSLRRLVLSYTKICMLPSTISQLSSLEILWLIECNELEELPMLPTSLVSLHFTSELLKRVPDLSVLSSLVDLVVEGFDSRLRSRSAMFSLRRKLSETWLSDKNQLEFKKSLQFCMSNVPTVPAEISGFFNQLESLELGCLELIYLPELPLSLSKLVLKYLKRVTKLTCISYLKNLSDLTLFQCSIGEDGIKNLGIGKLQHLKRLSVVEDRSELNGLSLPGSLQILDFSSCKYFMKLLELSHLKILQELWIGGCKELSEIQGLGGLKSLQVLHIGKWESRNGARLHLPMSLKKLSIISCMYLVELPNLSHLRNLEFLYIQYCQELLAIRGLGGLESLRELDINFCKSLKIFGRHMPVNLEKLSVFSCSCLSELPNLSCLKKLKKLVIYDSRELVKISGLEEMESLKELSIRSCCSLKMLGCQMPVSLEFLKISSCRNLKRLPNVSNLKNLQALSIEKCDVEIPGIEELKWMKRESDISDGILKFEAY